MNTNMRVSGTVTGAVAPAAEVVAKGRYIPFTHCYMPGMGRFLIMRSGTQLAALDLDGADGRPQPIATLPAEPLCIRHDGAGTLTVMLPAGPYLIHCVDRRWEVEGYPAPMPSVTLRTRDVGELAVAMPPLTLSRVYDASATSLTAADMARLSDAYVAAYRDLSHRARLLGAYVQPVVARCRFIDYDDAVVHVTPPVVLMHPTARAQCAGFQTFASADRRTLTPGDVCARAYSVEIEIGPTDKWTAGRIARVELMVSPQLHPWVAGASPQAHLLHGAAGAGFVNVALPGHETAVCATYAAVGTARLRRVVACLDSLCPRAAFTVAAAPDELSARTIVAPTPESVYPEAEAALIDRAAAGDGASVSPDVYAASTVAGNGALALWGKLRRHRFEGYGIGCFAAAVAADRSWHAAIQVRFGDGSESVVWRGEGSTGAPTLLHPLLSYPAPDAVAMTVTISRSGEAVRTQTFALTPVPEAGCAVYVDPSLAPFDLAYEAEAYVIPAEVRVVRELPRHIASGDASGRITAMADTGGTVHAVAAASYAGGAWDYGRARFYAFTDSGIVAVNVAAGGRGMAVNTIDPRRCGAVCDTVHHDGTVYAVAGSRGDLVAIKHNSVATVMPAVGCGARLGFDGRAGELWVSAAPAGDGASADIVCVPVGDRDAAYRRSGGPLAAVYNGAGESWGVTPQGAVVSLGDAGGADRVDIVYRSVLPLPKGRRHPGRILLGATGRSVDVDIEVRESTPAGAGALLCRLHVAGSLLSPLPLTLPAAPVRGAVIEIRGSVSPDFTISNISLE